MEKLETVVNYLKENNLLLAVAESCTAGLVVAELARVPGSGQCLECGLTVYSPAAKNRLLSVGFDIIERHGLTSEAVALAMAVGALGCINANAVVANSGVAGPEPGDDRTPVGTVCFAWAFRRGDTHHTYTETRHFTGDRNEIRLAAAHYALEQLPFYHREMLEQQSQED